MMLENARMRLEIADLGAELMHIFDRKHNTELLWHGDAAYWKRRSPVLFPNVGKTYGNVMRTGGGEYPTCQHGFARDMAFTLEEKRDDAAVYLLSSSAETLQRYPHPFELRIIYRLEGNVLKVIWRVKNCGEETMAFTIGGHPAFCFSEGEDKADYHLYFPGKDALKHLSLDAGSGTALPGDVHEIALEDGCLALNDALFAHDALILDGNQVQEVWLCRNSGEKRIGMKCAAFPNFGIWSVQGAPFVCLEPWQGRCDDHGFCGEYGEKQGAVNLNAGQEFEIAYEIVLPE